MEKQNIPDAVPFKFGKKLKQWLIVAVVIGIVALIAGVFIQQIPAERIWANLWLNALMFLFLGLSCGFSL